MKDKIIEKCRTDPEGTYDVLIEQEREIRHLRVELESRINNRREISKKNNFCHIWSHHRHKFTPSGNKKGALNYYLL
jgi:hypothetical protein